MHIKLRKLSVGWLLTIIKDGKNFEYPCPEWDNVRTYMQGQLPDGYELEVRPVESQEHPPD